MNSTSADCSLFGRTIERPINSSILDNLDDSVIKSTSVVQLLICGFGTVGNLLSLIVIGTNRKLHTIPNLYIGHLALVDLLICICIPVSSIQLLVLDEPIEETPCKIVGYITVMSFAASLLSMMMVAINRYILIMKGRGLYNKLYSKRKFIISLILIWSYLFLIVVVPPEAGFGQYGYNEKFGTCVFLSYCFDNYIYISVFLTLLLFVPQSIGVGYCYIRIIHKLILIKRKIKRRNTLRARTFSACSVHEENMDSGVVLESTPTEFEVSDDDLGCEFDSEEEEGGDNDTDAPEHKVSLRRYSLQHRDSTKSFTGTATEEYELAHVPIERNSLTSHTITEDSDSESHRPSDKRRRSSCIPMPYRTLKMKLHKPQWRKRCLAVANLITIYIILWICWTPAIIEYMLDLEGMRPANAYHVKVTFLYLNSACNVLLYAVMNSTHRKAYKHFFRRCLKCFRRKHEYTL